MFFKQKKIEKEVRLGKLFLESTNNRSYLIDLSSKLSKTNHNAEGSHFGISDQLMQLALKQFIIQRFLFTTLNISVLRALGRNDKLIRCTLPPNLRKRLHEEEGFKSSEIINKFSWLRILFYWYIRGIYSIVEHFFFLIKGEMPDSKSNYIFFSALSSKNFPNNFKNSKTIINWVLNKEKFKKLNQIYHDAKIGKTIFLDSYSINECSLPFYVNPSAKNILNYVISSIKICFISFFKMLLGNYSYALLLSEYPKLYLSKNTGEVNFARNYYFHNSTSILRPLWTYQAENKGSSIILYFYSAHIYTYKSPKGKYYNELYNYRYLSWPKYYVWHDYHKKYLVSLLGEDQKNKFEIVGPVWFESSNSFDLPKIARGEKIISIFDINVYNSVHFLSLGHPNDYFTSETLLKFHNDIIEVIGKCKNTIGILKNKRAKSKFDSKSYNLKLETLYKKNRSVLKTDASLDAHSLIENSVASINIPFTSTAHVANYLGIPSVYYDPVQQIQPDDRGLSGIPLIQDKEDLALWLNSVIK